MEENKEKNVMENGENIADETKRRNIRIGVVILAVVVVLALVIGMVSQYNKKKQLEEAGNLFSNVFNQASDIISNAQSNSGIDKEKANEFVNDFTNMANEMSSDFFEETDEEKSEKEKSTFNSKFESHKGTNQGLFVSQVLGDVVASNNSHEKQISVKFDGQVVKDTVSIKGIMSKLDNMTSYIVSFSYDSEGYINMMIID